MRKQNINHIFVDTNVLIGALSSKKHDKDCLQYLFSLIGKKLYISSLSIAQLTSVFQKKKTNKEITSIVTELLNRFTVLSFTKDDITASLAETGADIEDNMQYIVSKKMKCYTFVTNNIKDYRVFGDIQVLKPENVKMIPR